MLFLVWASKKYLAQDVTCSAGAVSGGFALAYCEICLLLKPLFSQTRGGGTAAQRVWNALTGICSKGQITGGSWHDCWWKPGALIWRKTTHFTHYAAFCESEAAWSRSTLRPRGLQPTRLLHPWDSPGESTGVGCHFLLQGIFLTQGLNPGLPNCRQTSEPPGRPLWRAL